MKVYTKKISFFDHIKKNKRALINQLNFELTERCNNRCVHCCVVTDGTRANHRANELPIEEIYKIISEAASLGCMTIRFTGGEPLLHRKFPEIYTFTRKAGIETEIFTNATAITDEIADLFLKIPPRKKISISLYGTTSESYEAVTQTPGSFEAAINGIKKLDSLKIPCHISLSILPQNIKDQDNYTLWVLENFPNSSGGKTVIPLHLHSRRSEERNLTIAKSRFSPDQLVNLMHKDFKDYKKELARFFERNPSGATSQLFICGAGIGKGTVGAYGNLQLCTMLRHPDTIYNLRKGSLRDAFTNFFPEILSLKTDNKAYLNRCGNCFLRGFCDHCPATSWTECGQIDSYSPYFCDIAHKESELLGLLKKGEKAWQSSSPEKVL